MPLRISKLEKHLGSEIAFIKKKLLLAYLVVNTSYYFFYQDKSLIIEGISFTSDLQLKN